MGALNETKNIDLKTRGSIIWIIVLSVVVSTTLLFIIYKQKKLDLLNAIAILGSVASLAGITIAYLQILSVKKVSETANAAIRGALDELYKSFSISDLSKAVKLTNEIQSFIRANKTEAALLRMQDLKTILIQIKHVEIIKGKIDLANYQSIVLNLGNDMSNINAILINQKPSINFQKIYSNLELVATFFAELENNLKYTEYE